MHRRRTTSEGSPPLTRGKGQACADPPRFHGITPAYAGKRPERWGCRGSRWDHPRLRGEKRKGRTIPRIKIGSPPLTRGKVIKPLAAPLPPRITPAYAGKSFSCGFPPVRLWDHPRLRGEKCRSARSDKRVPGSPPLTRGKADKPSTWRKGVGITPAYAGKRPVCLPERAGRQDHPRLRGEKKTSSSSTIYASGSPPLTRGKAATLLNSMLKKGITPAYAGKSKTAESLISR